MLGTLDELRLLRPAWLLAIPLVLLVCHRARRRLATAGWQGRVAPVQLAALGVGETATRGVASPAVALALVTACVALAGPSWRALPGEGGRGGHAMVLLFDLSPSMLARDVRPDRLTRARLKLLDLLEERRDGETALVVYAGDAHRVTPLTDDPAVIATLVPTLHPDIMPLPGSRPEAALAIALKTFAAAGRDSGDIVLVTDGMHPDAIAAVDARLPRGYRLSILGVGGEAGAPVPDPDGGYLRDARGEAVLARLDGKALAALAARFDGRYVRLAVDGRDVARLAALASVPLGARVRPDGPGFERHEDGGYWLVLALLPLAALGFRRGLLWAVLPLALVAPEARALDWTGLWLSEDQRAARALARGDAAEAAARFRDRRWRAVARYRAGEPAGAAELLADAAETAADHYNLGNALALAGELEAALGAYDRALALLGGGRGGGVEDAAVEEASGLADDARHNRAEVAALLERAREEEQQRERDADEDERGGRDGTDAADGEETRAPDSPGADETRGSDARREVGGSAVAGRSLAQDALADGGPSARDPAAREDDPAAARDATPAADRRAVDGDRRFDDADARDADTAAPRIEAGDERLLTPYSERWLRTLPQDPRGYLRRKFAYRAALRALAREGEPGHPELGTAAPDIGGGDASSIASEPRY